MNKTNTKKLMGVTLCRDCGRQDWDVLCSHCEPRTPTDAPPEHWAAWSEAERSLWEQIQTNDMNAETAVEQLRQGLTPEQVAQFNQVEEMLYGARGLSAAFLAARLTRYLPGFADLIDFAGPNGGEIRDCCD